MGEWRFASIKLGILFVMSTGIMLMQVLYVISWDYLQMVSLYPLNPCSVRVMYQLGYWQWLLVSGALALRGVFTERVWPLTITNITCSGSESNLLECIYSTEPLSACNVLRDAAVACQSMCQCTIILQWCVSNHILGEETEYSNCSDGDVRLADGQTALSGRLEVCYSKTWGTVCNYAWGNEDSGVACRQLGFQPYGKGIIRCVKILNQLPLILYTL
jgi:hypothetical protein